MKKLFKILLLFILKAFYNFLKLDIYGKILLIAFVLFMLFLLAHGAWVIYNMPIY